MSNINITPNTNDTSNITSNSLCCPRTLQTIQGPQGFSGKRGPRGIQGVPGTNGQPGPQGVQGLVGALGPNGPPGPSLVGPPGPHGAPGPPGPEGEDGPRGSPGSFGLHGLPGPSGYAGSKGATGDTGPTGSQGYIGQTGNFSIFIETALDSCISPNSGPIELNANDLLRFWSKGGISLQVQAGSVLLELELENLTSSTQDPSDPPPDRSRPQIYVNSLTGKMYFWDPNAGLAGAWVIINIKGASDRSRILCGLTGAFLQADNPDGWIAIGPNAQGGGFLSASIPDGSIQNGFCRGKNGIDLQIKRSKPIQVAYGDYSVITSGKNNQISKLSPNSVILGGHTNAILNDSTYSYSSSLPYSEFSTSKNSIIGSGYQNITKASYSNIFNGSENYLSSLAQFSSIANGRTNVIDRERNTANQNGDNLSLAGAWIGTGQCNILRLPDSIIISGESNKIQLGLTGSGEGSSFIGGGGNNIITGPSHVILNGRNNQIRGFTKPNPYAQYLPNEFNSIFNGNNTILDGSHLSLVNVNNLFLTGKYTSIALYTQPTNTTSSSSLTLSSKTADYSSVWIGTLAPAPTGSSNINTINFTNFNSILNVNTDTSSTSEHILIGNPQNALTTNSPRSVILGGKMNTQTGGSHNVILNGNGQLQRNTKYSSILTGISLSTLDSNYTTMISGKLNTIIDNSDCSAILTGTQNTVNHSSASVITSGSQNSLYDSDNSMIGTGREHNITSTQPLSQTGTSQNSSIFTGRENELINSPNSSILSGFCNRIHNSTNSFPLSILLQTTSSFIGAGRDNETSISNFIFNGLQNKAGNTGATGISEAYSWIGTGRNNRTNFGSHIITGRNNDIGAQSQAQVQQSEIFTGKNNIIQTSQNSAYSTILNGHDNQIGTSSPLSPTTKHNQIFTGHHNLIDSTPSSTYNTIISGNLSEITGNFNTILQATPQTGLYSNSITGDYNFLGHGVNQSILTGTANFSAWMSSRHGIIGENSSMLVGQTIPAIASTTFLPIFHAQNSLLAVSRSDLTTTTSIPPTPLTIIPSTTTFYNSAILTGMNTQINESLSTQIHNSLLCTGRENSMAGGSDANAILTGFRNVIDISIQNSLLTGNSNHILTSNSHSVILGGSNNTIQINPYTGILADSSFIGGGSGLTLNSKHSGVFGKNQTVSGNYSVISGGYNNLIPSNLTLHADYVFIGNGYAHKLISSGSYATIFGGFQNGLEVPPLVSYSPNAFHHTTFIGGYKNVMSISSNTSPTGVYRSTIAAGAQNRIENDHHSMIFGGKLNQSGHNDINNAYNTIGGGKFSKILNADSQRIKYSTILGGLCNEVATSFSSIVGGKQNKISIQSPYCFIGSGRCNSIIPPTSSPIPNSIANYYSSILSGKCNLIQTQMASFISSGKQNQCYADYSVIIGGRNNHLEASFSAILGGSYHTLGIQPSPILTPLGGTGMYSLIGGGRGNTNYGKFSSLLGGRNNQCYSDYSVIFGGYNNVIQTPSTDPAQYTHNAIITSSTSVIRYMENSAILGGRNNTLGVSSSTTPIPFKSQNCAILGSYQSMMNASGDQTTINSLIINSYHCKIGNNGYYGSNSVILNSDPSILNPSATYIEISRCENSLIMSSKKIKEPYMKLHQSNTCFGINYVGYNTFPRGADPLNYYMNSFFSGRTNIYNYGSNNFAVGDMTNTKVAGSNNVILSSPNNTGILRTSILGNDNMIICSDEKIIGTCSTIFPHPLNDAGYNYANYSIKFGTKGKIRPQTENSCVMNECTTTYAGSFMFNCLGSNPLIGMGNFDIVASGGTYLFSNPALTTGVSLPSGSSMTSWSMTCDVNTKTNLRLQAPEGEGKEILQNLMNVPVYNFRFKTPEELAENAPTTPELSTPTEASTPPELSTPPEPSTLPKPSTPPKSSTQPKSSTESIRTDMLGPMAQDFYEAFKLGNSDRRIADIDMFGVELASIQALNSKIEKHNQRLQKAIEQIKSLKTQPNHGEIFQRLRTNGEIQRLIQIYN